MANVKNKKMVLGIFLIIMFAALLALNIILPIQETYAYAEGEESVKQIAYISDINVSEVITSVTSGSSSKQCTVALKYKLADGTSVQYGNPNYEYEKLAWCGEDTNTGKAYVGSILYDSNGYAYFTIGGAQDGSAKIFFYGIYHDEKDSTARSVTITIAPFEKKSDVVKNLLTSNTTLILVITVCATALSRTAIKVFRFGVNYKSNFATVDQQKEFESTIREEIRIAKTDMQDSTLKVCLREIARETKSIAEIQEVAASIKTDKEVLIVKVDEINKKYNEIRAMGDRLSQLEQQVNRLMTGQGTDGTRRMSK